MNERELRAEIIFFCHRMDQKGWVANHDGNVTVKISDNRFLATPGARSKGLLKESDLIEVDSTGKILAGQGAVFSELFIHLMVYSKRPDVKSVVHAHPISATAVGTNEQEVITWAIPEAVVSLGPGIPVVGLAIPQSSLFKDEFSNIVPYYDSTLVAGNGVFSWGKNLEQAFLRLELTEHVSSISLAALKLGGPKLLPKQSVLELLQKRKSAGLGLPEDPARPHWFQ